LPFWRSLGILAAPVLTVAQPSGSNEDSHVQEDFLYQCGARPNQNMQAVAFGKVPKCARLMKRTF
jgi:hypothetical protein